VKFFCHKILYAVAGVEAMAFCAQAPDNFPKPACTSEEMRFLFFMQHGPGYGPMAGACDGLRRALRKIVLFVGAATLKGLEEHQRRERKAPYHFGTVNGASQLQFNPCSTAGHQKEKRTV
jgi:hypothetical protein